MLIKMNFFKHNKVQLVLVALTFPIITKADNSIFENNLDIQANKTKIESTQFDLKINKSLFLPELSINTGLGSEYTKDKNDTDKGPFLYVDGKINLYRGGKDLNQDKILQSTNHKLISDNETILRKTKIEAYKLISNIDALQIDTKYLNDEIKDNDFQLKMAKKKVDAGLTTSADLLDFQIKNETLQNEINSNQFKIEDLEKELKNLFGNKLTFDQIKSDMNFYELKINTPANAKDLPLFQSIRSELNAITLEVKNLNGEYLPTVDIEAKYGSITPNNKLFENKTEHQIALNVNIPLFSGFSTDAKKSKAILESTQKERELRQTEIELEKSIEQDKKKIELNEKIKLTLEKSLEKATKYKELTIFEYKKGIKNSSDVINASDKKLELSRKINELKQESKILTFSFNTNYQSTEGKK